MFVLRLLQIYRKLKIKILDQIRVDRKNVISDISELRHSPEYNTYFTKIADIGSAKVIKEKPEYLSDRLVNQFNPELITWNVDGVFACLINECSLHLPTGLVFLPNTNKYVHEFCYGHAKYRTSQIKSIKHHTIHNLTSTHPLYPFCFYGYHGIVEDLASVASLNKLGVDFDIVISGNNQWMISLLNYFGFQNIYIQNDRNWISSDNGFILTNKSSKSEYVHPNHISALRRLHKHNKIEATAKRRNLTQRLIYVARGNRAKRNLKQEPQLINLLESNGFETVYLENKTVDEQIQIFQNARAIVGLHGAGLTNMVWSGQGASVLELFTQQHYNDCYRSLAHSCGHKFTSIPVNDGECQLTDEFIQNIMIWCEHTVQRYV